MKKLMLLMALAIGFIACDSDDNTAAPNVNVSINFTQNFDGTPITAQDFDSSVYTNANGEPMTLTRLRYLMSDITFTNEAGASVVVEDYNLVQVNDNVGLSIDNFVLPAGDYMVTMRFGFEESKNTTNAYPDLNAASWNVPVPIGGGYHYQQLDGKFTNTDGNEEVFNFHTISAPTNAMMPDVTREDTSIAINLGTISISGTTTTIEVKSNIAEWFKNPVTWNLNVLNRMLMGNNSAQLLMFQNGQDVFSLGTVTNN